jgi:hypothetical protein
VLLCQHEEERRYVKMSIVINAPAVENRLQQEAVKHGVSAAEYALQILSTYLGSETVIEDSTTISRTLALFSAWSKEDSTNDPDELIRRQQEGDELLSALDSTPLSLRNVELIAEDVESAQSYPHQRLLF